MKKFNPSKLGPTRKKISRRKFIKKTLTLFPFMVVQPYVAIPLKGQVSPNNKLNIAVIGAGGRGAEDIEGVKTENIVALCDVDWDRAAPTFKKFPDTPKYKDFRVMLDKEKNVDAVIVATPDHTHAVASSTAIKSGKHVYCEKPLTRTMFEARTLAKLAKQYQVATQMGNQGMAFEGNRLINEWIWAGVIGQIYEVHVWSDRPTHRGKLPLWWDQGIDRPKDTPAVPLSLDWDLWLGPAPWRPYHPAYVPFKWRGWWDFGSGGLGDMGIHNLAPVFVALKLDAPVAVHASSTPVFKETLPAASIVHFQFPPTETNGLPLKIHWYDGGLLPERPEELEDEKILDPEDGILFVGTKGKILVEGWGGQSPRLIPESKNREFPKPPKYLPRSVGHYQEWIRACKLGTKTSSNFEFASRVTETVLLGTISVRLNGEKLIWDTNNFKITNLPEANNYLHYEYRKGWTL